jgi:hypothetical protein
MNIRDEEQLQQYFERQMTGAQEQNFLINVAARDDMRLAFRSQLELLKAVREDKDASGSPTFIRTKTLTALGLGGALVPSGLKEKEVEASVVSTSMWQNIGAAFKRPVVSVATGLLAGVLGTAFLMPSNTIHESAVSPNPIISAPAIQTPATTVPAAVTAEPAKDQPAKSVSNHVPIMPAHHQAVTHQNSTPVLDNQSPGEIEVKTKIHKPEESGKK